MSLIVNTKYGKVDGFETNNIKKWFGIPYAKPPIGELRFKRALVPEQWTGIRECKVMEKRPYQFGNDKAALAGKGNPMSEDCLYLNIWASKEARNAPVFVWIYGGANHQGEASIPDYFLDAFARDGVIGVSFNYRLGPLGFYDFSKLDQSFDSNCAPSDMIMAVRWVKENISEFGGDPDNITICGESAGGTGVYALLSALSAKGSFNKAIAMSGLSGNINTYRTHELNNELFFRTLGLAPKNVAELKTMPYEKMFPAAAAVFTDNNKYNQGIMLTGPVIDDLLPLQPWEALAAGSAKDVACIFGTCHDEGTLFYKMKMVPCSWQDVGQMLKNSGCQEKLPLLKQLYSDMNEKQAMQAIARERLFWSDSVKCTLAQCVQNTTYSYRFDFESVMSKLLGFKAMHSSDIPAGLDTWEGNSSALNKLTSKKRLKRIKANVHGAFVNFAKNGNPNGSLPVEWKQYDEKMRSTFIFNDICTVENDPNRKYYEVWKDIDLYQ